MKKVLVTGAGGFIGSHLAERLVRHGCKVKAFVHYNSRNFWGWLESCACKQDMEIVTGDVRDADILRHAMRDIDTVYHLAALIGIPYSYHSPQAYVDTNINGALNILESAKDYGVKRIIITSTSEIYGTAQKIPIAETHPINPQSPYAASKAAADLLALSFYRSFDLPVVIVRPFNTYGPRQSARAIIPTIITQIISNQKKIRLGALAPTRDLTYIEDTVNGFIRAGESRQAIGEVINLGSNSEISIKDLSGLIAKIIGAKISIESDIERMRPEKSEVERLFADTEKAKKLLEWKPGYTLEKGLEKTIAWFKKNRDIYKSEIYNL